ncbi:hypothetical protein B9T31_16655 [Acinetobacter sp. ANC 4558]|uniref:hypothetical protein n=1 Tax=Acinetobacter sp. ANC 4558 TaxID=1977876 RepID=UPI000A334A80|nr:hypothetical protein [Acinetobacter sp. ANC 4558]OTG79871.1 hypothetical protein B9T31_16655 [Acinetobacter sp. ANC 4558]
MNFLKKNICLIIIILMNMQVSLHAQEENNIFNYPSKWEIKNIVKNSCYEYISFISDTDIKMESGSEILLATYKIIKPHNPNDLILFTIKVKEDNMKPDCENIAINDSNRTFIYYVKPLSKKRLLFCENNNLESCEIRARLYE